MGKLTEALLRRWMAEGRPITGRSDGDGLTFTLSPKGAATWVLRYRFDHRPREITLARYPRIPLSAARTLAREMLTKIELGEDVAATRKRTRQVRVSGGTFRQLAEDYLDKCGSDLAASTLTETKRYLDRDLLPALGSLAAVDITASDIVGAIERIAARSKSVARRAFEILSVIFSHAVAKRVVASNPCSGLKVRSVIGAPRPARQRLQLTREELRSILLGLPNLGKSNDLCARILLATCVRKSELFNALWEHVDLQAGLWTVPAEATKSRRGFVVPLAPQVVRWFKELKLLAGGSSAVLPGRAVRYGTRRGTVSRSTLNNALHKLEVGARRFSPHDLRSTARSYLAELGVDPLVAERCLNHSLGGLVAIYDQYDYLEERRRALCMWAALLEEVECGATQRLAGPVMQPTRRDDAGIG